MPDLSLHSNETSNCTVGNKPAFGGRWTRWSHRFFPISNFYDFMGKTQESNLVSFIVSSYPLRSKFHYSTLIYIPLDMHSYETSQGLEEKDATWNNYMVSVACKIDHLIFHALLLVTFCLNPLSYTPWGNKLHPLNWTQAAKFSGDMFRSVSFMLISGCEYGGVCI